MRLMLSVSRSPLALILLSAVPALIFARDVAAQAPVATVAPPTAMPLEAVLARHAQATGPYARSMARRSRLMISGLAPFEIPIEVEAMRPNLLRKTMTLQGSAQITAYDGTSAWRIDPFARAGNAPIDVPPAELADLLEEIHFDGPLLARGSDAPRLAYAGATVVTLAGRRVAVHSVRVTFAGGRESTVHLDATSFLEVLRTQRRPVMGADTEMSIISSDYRPVRGLQVPHHLEIRVTGAPAPIRIVLQSIELEVPITRARFVRPTEGR
jgi:hypothetical protein